MGEDPILDLKKSMLPQLFTRRLRISETPSFRGVREAHGQRLKCQTITRLPAGFDLRESGQDLAIDLW
jgi:hypothetical protein